MQDSVYQSALNVMKLLEGKGFQARLAGGCVRDRLLGITPKDYDIATTARPEQVSDLCLKAGWKVIPTGIQHGTVTVVHHHHNIEVTTLRKDVDTDGRHAVVEFQGATFQDDAERRDLTINALFEDQNQDIGDYVGGQADIANRVLRFVGSPDTRIKEDFLRVLRFLRFWARFGFEPDPASLEAIRRHFRGLERVSQERITGEWTALLGGDHCFAPLEFMNKQGILQWLFPDVKFQLNQPALKSAQDEFTTMPQELKPLARFIFLLHSAGDWTPPKVEPLCRKMKLSLDETARLRAALEGIAMLKELGTETADALEFVSFVDHLCGDGSWSQWFAEMLTSVLRASCVLSKEHAALIRVRQVEEQFGDRLSAKMPVNGQQVMHTLGIQAGPELGRLLKAARRSFLNGEWSTLQEGIAFLQNLEN